MRMLNIAKVLPVLLILSVPVFGASDEDSYKKGVEFINNYEYESSMKEMEKVIASASAAGDMKVKAYFWVAFINLMGEDRDMARDTFNKMLKNGLGADYDITSLPDELSQVNELMEIYNKENREYSKEKKKLDKQVGKYIDKAEKYYEKGDYERAQEYLSEVLSLDPGNVKAETMRAGIEAGKAGQEAAETASAVPAAAALKVDSGAKEEADKYMARAEKYYSGGNMDKALQSVTAALEADPENTQALSLKGKIEEKSREEAKKAAGELKAAVQPRIEDINAEEVYAAAVKKVENYEMASAFGDFKMILDSKVALTDTKVKSYFWVAFIHIFDGNEKQASLTIKDMLRNGLGLDYDTSKLPRELSKNIQLMGIYSEEKEKVPGAYAGTQKATEKLVDRAESFYRKRKLIEAERHVDIILDFEPGNERAVLLKRRIQTVRKLRVETRKQLVEDIFSNAKYYYASNNMIGAVQDTYKVLELNPKHQDAYSLYQDAYTSLQGLVKTLNDRDRARFTKAVNYYLEGDYDPAIRIFRNLSQYVPDISVLLGQSEIKRIEIKNKKHARKHYKRAVRQVKKSRYKVALEELLLAQMLDRFNLDVLVLLEEVKLELAE
ncbi:MAG: hypothetical protein JXJ19_05855 [Elusimicrobia bacterium]|nr:hypothetical protein [Elusimicrobiota bacterium]